MDDEELETGVDTEGDDDEDDDEPEGEVTGTPEENPSAGEAPAPEGADASNSTPESQAASPTDAELAAQSAQVEADAAAAAANEAAAQAQMPEAPAQEQPVSAQELQQQAEAQASIPRLPDGTPIPPTGTVTADQLANNPSDLQNAQLNPTVASDIQQTADAIAQTEGGGPGENVVPADAAVAEANPSNAGVQPEPMVPAAPAAPADPRQLWLCVSTEGPRTECPPFNSDAHLIGQQVVCPNCNSVSVRRPLAGEAV